MVPGLTIFQLYNSEKVILTINDRGYSTLYSRRGFVLGDFARPWANANAPGTRKAGETKLRCAAGEVYEVHFDSQYSQLPTGRLGRGPSPVEKQMRSAVRGGVSSAVEGMGKGRRLECNFL